MNRVFATHLVEDTWLVLNSDKTRIGDLIYQFKELVSRDYFPIYLKELIPDMNGGYLYLFERSE